VELKTGEAFFEVQPDHSRPFVVRAGSVTVTAVGTKFNVRRTRERTIVSVTEGAVDVVADSAIKEEKTANMHSEALATPVRVSAGQQAVRAITQPGLTLTDIDPAAVAAWRGGRLEYVMEPLGSVIDDVNRYGRHPIEIRDAQLRDLVFTGTVFRDQIDSWPLTLGSAFPVKATVGADGVIVLEARSEK
jgi:transmembrane sensor